MSGRRKIGLWVTSALCAGAMLCASSARAGDAISEEAKAYFKNGVELIQDQPPNYQDAYYQFRLAYEKSKSWKVLGNLGLCSFKLERDGEAIQYYSDYLKGGGKDIDPDERAALERDLLVLNGNSATVTLTSASADIDLADTRAGSSAPPQSYRLEGGKLTLRLRAGTHTLTASHAGKALRWEVALSPGRSNSHDFDFSEQPAPVAAAPVAALPAAAAASTAPAPPPEPASSAGSPVRTIGFVSAGVGVAALAGGVVVGLMAKGKENDAKSMCRDALCPASAESQFDSAQSLATVSNVLVIGGGVLTAAGIGMIVLGGHKNEARKSAAVSLRVLPALARDSAVLWASGSF